MDPVRIALTSSLLIGIAVCTPDADAGPRTVSWDSEYRNAGLRFREAELLVEEWSSTPHKGTDEEWEAEDQAVQARVAQLESRALAHLQNSVTLPGADADPIALVHRLNELLGRCNLALIGPEPAAPGAKEKAEIHGQRAWTLARKHLEPGDPLRLAVLEEFSRTYSYTYSDGDAIPLLERWNEEALLVLPAPDVYRSFVGNHLAAAYKRTGQHDKAQLYDKDEDGDRFNWELRASTFTLEGPLPEYSPEVLDVRPNVRDRDGTPAYVFFGATQMPLRVHLPRPGDLDFCATRDPDGSESDRTCEDLLGFWSWRSLDHSASDLWQATFSALRELGEAMRRVDPGFEFAGDFRVQWGVRTVSEPSEANVRVTWRPPQELSVPARGRLDHKVDRGQLRVAGNIELTAPLVAGGSRSRPTLLEFKAEVMRAFGFAIGLSDCESCAALMSRDWRERGILGPTDLDIRRFESLIARRNGIREDGKLLEGLSSEPVGSGPP